LFRLAITDYFLFRAPPFSDIACAFGLGKLDADTHQNIAARLIDEPSLSHALVKDPEGSADGTREFNGSIR
jgi:hypothetical protein